MLTPVPPSDCMRAREFVSAGLDGELSELEAAHLDGHLGACATCRAYAAGVAATAALLRSAPLERVDLPALHVSGRRSVSRVQLAAAALLVAAVTGSSFVIGREVGSHGPPPARTATGAGPSYSEVIGMLRGHAPEPRPSNRAILV